MSDYKRGDRVMANSSRVAHIVRKVDGNFIKTLCMEREFYDQPSSRGLHWIAFESDPTCKTCEKRAAAAARRAARK